MFCTACQPTCKRFIHTFKRNYQPAKHNYRADSMQHSCCYDKGRPAVSCQRCHTGRGQRRKETQSIGKWLPVKSFIFISHRRNHFYRVHELLRTSEGLFKTRTICSYNRNYINSLQIWRFYINNASVVQWNQQSSAKTALANNKNKAKVGWVTNKVFK